MNYTVGRRAYLGSLAAAAALLIVAWTSAPPLYLTNDDVTMRLAVEGLAVPGAAPTGYVLMTHAALGWTLATLQPLMRSVVAWDVALTVTLALGIAALVALAWTVASTGRGERLVAVTATLAACVPLTAGVQFTISSTVAGGAAAALLVFEEMAASPRRTMRVLAWALLVLAILVRPMAAAAGALIVVALLLPRALLDPVRERSLFTHGVLLVAIAALATALIYIDSGIYKADPEWDAYNQYNWIAARLVEWGGNVPPADVDAVRASAGWSFNDWRMLQAWWGVDPAVHGFPQLTRAHDAQSVASGWERAGEWLTLAWLSDGSLPRLAQQSAYPLAIIGVVAAAGARRRSAIATLAALAIFVVACLAIEAGFKELPFRLLAPLQTCLVSAVVLTVASDSRRPAALTLLVAALVLLVLAFVQWREIAEQARAERRHSDQVHREVAALMDLGPSLLVFHADAFPSEHWWRPFEPSQPLAAVQLGMNNQSPLLQHYLRAAGRQPLISAICHDPSIFVVAQPGRLEFASQYMQEHWQTPVAWTPVFSASFQAFRCERQR